MIEPPLPCLAAILARSRCYVGNDSGVTHLAAGGWGTPSSPLFGPTDPRIWGPRGEWTLTLRRAEGCPRLRWINRPERSHLPGGALGR